MSKLVWEIVHEPVCAVQRLGLVVPLAVCCYVFLAEPRVNLAGFLFAYVCWKGPCVEGLHAFRVRFSYFVKFD